MAAPVILRLPFELLCGLIDLLFEDRPLARFWFLETVARMPYFSYISMLHLYESLGWWRRSAEIKRVHFAEEWNVRSYNKKLCNSSTTTILAPIALLCSQECSAHSVSS